MYLEQPGFTYLLKTRKEYKNLKKKEIQHIVFKTK